MKAIRRSEALSDFLAGELAWRKKELTDIKMLVSSNRGKPRESVLIRTSLPVLYAHLEGFVKQASTAYLNFVSNQKLKLRELSTNFVAIGAKRILFDASVSKKAAIHNKAVEFLFSAQDEVLDIAWKNAVNTKANLNSEVFEDICCLLGVDFSFFETKKMLIDERLLKNRNEIAHGEYLMVDYESYIELHDEILAILEAFRTDLENCCVLETYKR